MYAYSSDEVDKKSKDFLEHFESNLSEEDYDKISFFIDELVGYINESDENRKELERKVDILETDVFRLKDSEKTFWFLFWVAYIVLAYKFGVIWEFIAWIAFSYLLIKIYAYYNRRQNKKIIDSLKKRQVSK